MKALVQGGSGIISGGSCKKKSDPPTSPSYLLYPPPASILRIFTEEEWGLVAPPPSPRRPGNGSPHSPYCHFTLFLGSPLPVDLLAICAKPPSKFVSGYLNTLPPIGQTKHGGGRSLHCAKSVICANCPFRHPQQKLFVCANYLPKNLHTNLHTAGFRYFLRNQRVIDKSIQILTVFELKY